MPRSKKPVRRPRYAGSVIVRTDRRVEVRYWTRNAFDRMERGAPITLPAGTPRPVAEALLAEMNAARDVHDLRIHGHETVAQWIERWLSEIVTPTRKPDTVDNYRAMLTAYVVPWIGALELRALQPRHIRALKAELTRTHTRRGYLLAPTTQALILRILKASLNDARRDGVVRDNPADMVKIGAPEAAERTWLTPEQARKVLGYFRTHPHRVAYELAVLRGLRNGEIRALTWRDVDLERRVLTVNGTLYRRSAANTRTLPPKSRRSTRAIPLSDALVEAFRLRRIQQLQDRLLAGPRWQDSDFVITTPDGKPVWGDVVLKRLRAACKAADVPVVTVHDLRHTANTIMANEGVDAATRMAILGQATERINRVYTHTSPERVEAALEQLERKIREA